MTINGNPFRSSEARPQHDREPVVAGALTLWTVYEKPLDYPDLFVARKWVIEPTPEPTKQALFFESIEQLRDAMRARGLFRIARHDGDDPVIVEVWI